MFFSIHALNCSFTWVFETSNRFVLNMWQQDCKTEIKSAINFQRVLSPADVTIALCNSTTKKDATWTLTNLLPIALFQSKLSDGTGLWRVINEWRAKRIPVEGHKISCYSCQRYPLTCWRKLWKWGITRKIFLLWLNFDFSKKNQTPNFNKLK